MTTFTIEHADHRVETRTTTATPEELRRSNTLIELVRNVRILRVDVLDDRGHALFSIVK